MINTLPLDIYVYLIYFINKIDDFINLSNTCKKLRKIYNNKNFKINWITNKFCLIDKSINGILKEIDIQFDNDNIFYIIKNNISFINTIFKLRIEEIVSYYIKRIKKRVNLLDKEKLNNFAYKPFEKLYIEKSILIKSFRLCLENKLFCIINILKENQYIDKYLYKLIINNKNDIIKESKILLFYNNWSCNIINNQISDFIYVEDIVILIKQNNWNQVFNILINSYKTNEYNIYAFKILTEYDIPLCKINNSIVEIFINNQLHKKFETYNVTQSARNKISSNLLKFIYIYFKLKQNTNRVKDIIKSFEYIFNNVDVFLIIIKNFNDNNYTRKLMCIFLDLRYMFREKNFLIIIEKKMLKLLEFLLHNIYIGKNIFDIKNLFLVGLENDNLIFVKTLIVHNFYKYLGNNFIEELININKKYNNSTSIFVNNIIEREKEKQNINFNLDVEDFIESDCSDF